MADISRVLSRRESMEAPPSPRVEDEDTFVDAQEPEALEQEPVYTFEERGITDHTTILLELMQGPSISVRVGKEQQLITLPKQMLMYHSPVAARRFAKSARHSNSDTLELPDDSPLAFAHICRWMHQDRLLVVPSFYEYLNDSSSWHDACTLLCLVFLTAHRLEITAVQTLVLMELSQMYAKLREEGFRTPITPSTVLAVWEEGGAECELWEEVLEEMCLAFSTKPGVWFSEYEECFDKIGDFGRAVGKAMYWKIEELQARVAECEFYQAQGLVCGVE